MSFGIIAALGKINIATTVTTPVLVTVLATIGGVIVVGFGGGLIKPAQRRWTDGWRIAGAIQQRRSAAAPGGHLAAAERRS